MPQRSLIETQLSPDDRGELDRMIASGRWTVDGVTEWLGERGYEISRSSVGRHIQKVEEAAQHLRQSRQIVEGLAKELGDSATIGQQGRLLVEMARSVAFDFLQKAQRAESAGLDAKDIAMLGKGLAELGRALRFDQDFETKIREQVAREEREKMAERLDEAIEGDSGLSEEAAASLRERVLGVRARSDGDGS